MTLPQAGFFLAAALADLTGRPATFTEIRATFGEAIGKSLHTTYRTLLDEGRSVGSGKRDPGLGWLMRETDATDNRRKYLRLTKKGREIVAELGFALDALEKPQ